MLVATVFAGIVHRAWLAASALFMGDEWHTLRAAWAGFGASLRTFDAFGSGLGLPFAVRCAAELGGWSEFWVRAPALLAGVAVLAGVFWLGRDLAGTGVALVATALASADSFLTYYAAFVRAYSVVAALSLLAAAAALAFLAPGRVRRRAPLALALATGLAPWFHVTGLAPIAALAGTAALVLGCRRSWRRLALLAASVAAGCLLAAALLAPARESLSEFLGRKGSQKYYGTFGALDVWALFFGNRVLAAGIAALLVPLGIGLALRTGARGLVVLAGLVGPLVALLVARPTGDPYAYARYASAAVPFACLVLAWGLERAVHRLGRGELALHGLGALAAAALFAGGSYGLCRTSDAPFQATTIGLYPLPAFDRPFPGTPEVYRRIAADEAARVVLEIPHLTQRSVHLYRNYALQHGKRVRTGFLGDNGGLLPDGYPSFQERAVRADPDADWVVVHLDAAAEAEDYWSTVYSEADARASDVRAYMERHERFGRDAEVPSAAVLAALERVLGRPAFEDARVRAWRLAR